MLDDLMIYFGHEPLTSSRVTTAHCVAQLRELPVSRRIEPGETNFTALCRKRYAFVKEHSMQILIRAQWLIGEVAEEGFSPASESESPSYSQEFRANLAKQHETAADLVLRMNSTEAAANIRKYIRKKYPVGTAQIAQYYVTHRQQFVVPAHRDVEEVQTWEKPLVAKVQREVREGKSFAGIVKRIARTRPGGASGNTSSVARGTMEIPLEEAIFSAKPNVLTGPVNIAGKYFLLEVRKIVPGGRITLAQAETTMRQKLTEQLQLSALERFISQWRAKWRARTTCKPGFVVQKCKEFKPTAHTHPEDPAGL